MEKRLFVLSGLHSRVADPLARRLRNSGADVAFVKLQDGASPDYFMRLANRTLALAETQLTAQNTRVAAYLISFLENPPELEREEKAFFPAFQRLTIPPSVRNDPGQVNRIHDDVLRAAIEIETTGGLKEAIFKDKRFLLPPRNPCNRYLLGELRAIYSRAVSSFSPRMKREITIQRGRGTYSIGSLIFAPANNGSRHPVRRMSPCAPCDLKARFRFGICVPERFEFDVSSAGSLSRRTFALCDGTTKSVSASATHLNMRINDDFKEAV